MTRERSDAARLVAGVGAVGVVTLAFARWLPAANAATISTTLLMVVLVVAATSRLWVAITTSFVAMLAFNFAFLPPVGTFTIADPQNWVALVAFLAVSLVASNLSAVARARASEAIGRRDELARLFDLSRDVLVGTESREALATLARSVARRFDLDYVAIALPRDEEWDIYDAGASMALDTRELASAFAAAQTTLEFDAYARTYAGHRTMQTRGRHGAPGAAARRHQADRAAGGRGAARRARHPRCAGRGRGHRRSSGRSSSRSARPRSPDPPERGAQDGAAGVAGTRPADAADRHPRRRRQPASRRAVRRGPAATRAN